MHEDTFSYQVLLDAVFSATGARASVYPDETSYAATSLDDVKSIVTSFDPMKGPTGSSTSHDQARRLWCRFKEYMPRCGCGIIRLMSPVPNDLVGIVTREDLLGMGFQVSRGPTALNREMMNDDLSEIHDAPLTKKSSFAESLGSKLKRRALARSPQDNNDLIKEIEMSLIDPETRRIFKRSSGGVFGTGNWQVSEIRAYAVWF
jgi:hypothetical protein